MTLLGASGEALAAELEKADALPTNRHLFHLPDGVAYLAGNSLGLQTRAASEAVNEAMHSWAVHGVEGHATGEFPWVNYHATMEHTAASLVGANPGEAVVMNTLTANLHVMLQSFYRPTAERFQIAFEANVFPSDRYAFLNTVQSHGYDSADGTVVITPAGEHLEVADVEAALQRSGHNIAVLMLSAIDFRTGALLDIAAITNAAHRFGVVVGWDLAHAVGNVPLRLHDWNVDFAVWCHYKYVNSGPGAVAGCFVHERHGNDSTLVRPGGWWGHDPATRFAMPFAFQAQPGAAGWQVSNPPILSMAPVRVSLDLFHRVGLEKLRARSIRLTGFLEQLLLEVADRCELRVVTPRDPERRGAQLSVEVADADGVTGRLMSEHSVCCDDRPPNIIRIAPTPLYNTFHDCWRAAEALAAVVPAR